MSYLQFCGCIHVCIQTILDLDKKVRDTEEASHDGAKVLSVTSGQNWKKIATRVKGLVMKIYLDEVKGCRKWYGWDEGDDFRHRKRTSPEYKYAGIQGVVRKHLEGPESFVVGGNYSTGKTLLVTRSEIP